MTKEDKKELKEISLRKELTRQDAKFVMRVLFDDSFYKMGNEINVPALWLKEQLSAIKPFSVDTQQRILQAVAYKIKPKSKKTKAS